MFYTMFTNAICFIALLVIFNPQDRLLASELPPLIAAASSVQFALQEINQMFTLQTGHSLRISYGSSGNLARQIKQGAPFELFLAADEANIEHLVKADLTSDKAFIYATGRLVLFSSLQSKLNIDNNMSGLKQAVKEGRIKRFSIANPDHAPYGIAAKQVLRHIKLWTTIKPYLVYGENVAQAAQFATHDAAQGGIIAYSFALEPNVKAKGRFELIPESLHQPIKQKMVLLKSAGDIAKLFFQYIQQQPARAILARSGFSIPIQ